MWGKCKAKNKLAEINLNRSASITNMTVLNASLERKRLSNWIKTENTAIWYLQKHPKLKAMGK